MEHYPLCTEEGEAHPQGKLAQSKFCGRRVVLLFFGSAMCLLGGIAWRGACSGSRVVRIGDAQLGLQLEEIVPSGTSIVDLQVMIGKKAHCPRGYSRLPGGDGLNGDFNQEAGGEDVWLCVKRGDHNPITDLVVFASDSAFGGCPTLGGSWHRVSELGGSDGDFNQRAGGKYVYLCYQKDQKTPIVSLTTTQDQCPSGYFRINHLKDSNGDFNQKAGGKDIFLCARHACVVQKVTGSWKQHGTIAAAVTEKWTLGTAKTHAQSNESSWSKSVTSTVAAGFSFKGVDFSAEISGTIAQSMSHSYSSEWLRNQEYAFEITFSESEVGKTAWQFLFEPSDSCGHTERTRVREFALTEGAWRPPCCLPGYATDAPAYTTCSSREVMIKNGEHYGCKVCR